VRFVARPRVCAAGLLLWFGLGLGCEAGMRRPDPGPPDGGGAPTPDAAVADTGLAPADYTDMYCALLAPCCAAAGRPDGAATCRATLVPPSPPPYRPDMAASCLTLLRAAADTPTFCTAGVAAAAATCARVFSAVVASQRLGEPCPDTAHCLLSPQGPVTCAGPMGMGRCQVALRGREGDGPCVATVGGPLVVPGGDLVGTSAKGYQCHVTDGLYCDDATAACARSKPAGAACTSFGECGPTHYCEDGSGRCTPRKREGAPCAVDEECPSTFCGEDNSCRPPPVVDDTVVRLCGGATP
jgi:hypothetical protein